MQPNDDLMPWWHDGAWVTDPGLAYVKGLQDGYRLRDGDLMAEWDIAYAQAFPQVGGKTPVESHFERIAQRDRRAQADVPGVRDGDYTGDPAWRPADPAPRPPAESLSLIRRHAPSIIGRKGRRNG